MFLQVLALLNINFIFQNIKLRTIGIKTWGLIVDLPFMPFIRIVAFRENYFAVNIRSGEMELNGNWWLPVTYHRASQVHTTLYGSAAGCRSIQKTCAFWKHGLTFENTQSQLTYFCKSNINQTFTNGSGMIRGVMIAIFTEIRHLVEELITFLSFFGPQKLGILTARLNKSLSISTSNSMRGDYCVEACPKPSQLLWEQQLLKNSVMGHVSDHARQQG